MLKEHRKRNESFVSRTCGVQTHLTYLHEYAGVRISVMTNSRDLSYHGIRRGREGGGPGGRVQNESNGFRYILENI